VLGLLYGLGLLTVGVVLGGIRLDRKAPELLGQLAAAQI
jgi:ABC-2 type transport system permease protein